jgi:hypothetical protein
MLIRHQNSVLLGSPGVEEPSMWDPGLGKWGSMGQGGEGMSPTQKLPSSHICFPYPAAVMPLGPVPNYTPDHLAPLTLKLKVSNPATLCGPEQLPLEL